LHDSTTNGIFQIVIHIATISFENSILLQFTLKWYRNKFVRRTILNSHENMSWCSMIYCLLTVGAFSFVSSKRTEQTDISMQFACSTYLVFTFTSARVLCKVSNVNLWNFKQLIILLYTTSWKYCEYWVRNTF